MSDTQVVAFATACNCWNPGMRYGPESCKNHSQNVDFIAPCKGSELTLPERNATLATLITLPAHNKKEARNFRRGPLGPCWHNLQNILSGKTVCPQDAP